MKLCYTSSPPPKKGFPAFNYPMTSISYFSTSQFFLNALNILFLFTKNKILSNIFLKWYLWYLSSFLMLHYFRYFFFLFRNWTACSHSIGFQNFERHFQIYPNFFSFRHFFKNLSRMNQDSCQMSKSIS